MNKKKNAVKAVALSYDKLKDAPPEVIALGKGFIAENIIELAKKHNIHLYKDPELVNALLKLDIGVQIPPELYKAVAKVLLFVYEMDLDYFDENKLYM